MLSYLPSYFPVRSVPASGSASSALAGDEQDRGDAEAETRGAEEEHEEHEEPDEQVHGDGQEVHEEDEAAAADPPGQPTLDPGGRGDCILYC